MTTERSSGAGGETAGTGASSATAPRASIRGALALGGPILFTPVALAVADREVAILGVPVLVLYVLGAWLLGIVLTFAISRGGR